MRELDVAREQLQSAAEKLRRLGRDEARERQDRAGAALHVARLEWSIALGRVMALSAKGHSHDSWD